MTVITQELILADLAGTPSLRLQTGREFQGEGFFRAEDLCWTADLNDLQRLSRALFVVNDRFRYQRPNTRVKPGFKHWRVGTEEANFVMGCGIEALPDGDFPYFEFGRRIYLSFEDLVRLYKTTDELIRAVNAEKRHNAEIRAPGPQRRFPSLVEQKLAEIGRKYGG
jgi:hypothetical protein